MEQKDRFMKLKEDLIKEQAIEKTEIHNGKELLICKFQELNLMLTCIYSS